MSDDHKPVLIYDGKCGFCKIWIDYWKGLTQNTIHYAASQDVASQYPQISLDEFRKSVQLVLPDGDVHNGAHAVFQTLSIAGSHRWLLWLYRNLPGFAPLTEAAYRLIAAHRDFFYFATVTLFGRKIEPLQYALTQWIFLKALAVIWLIAFISFGVQASALIGSDGVLPAAFYLARVREVLGSEGWYAMPSIFWLQSGDGVIQAVWIGGVVCALLALFGVFWRAALLGAFLLYLSLFNVAQEFLSFQWDILLLETGLLAVFVGYSPIVVWLFRWLLFRLMFLSGAVKLVSGDPTWHGLTALLVHFQTQPIPTPLAWYVHQLPSWFLKASCLLVLVIELAIPFLVLGPRRLRLFAAPWLIGLQVLILLTGNYAFFNWLAFALCLFLFHDGILERWLPRRRPVKPLRSRPAVAVSLAVIVGVLSTAFFLHTLRWNLPTTARSFMSMAAPFGITSSYGLFANMTTTRPEIVIEGSSDGVTWLEYEFRYKPGRLDRRPPWVAPHQPRIDWQMWFATLGSYQENMWFLNLLARLLQGSPAVLAQIEQNPFPGAPPRQIRAQLYEYRFTDWSAHRSTGQWWTRTPLRPYVPAISLNDLAVLPLLKWQQAAKQSR